MTMNDLFVNERCLLIRRLAEELPKLMRDNRAHDLFIALSNIDRMAKEAQDHLNDVRFRREVA